MTDTMTTAALFTPFTIGNLELPNRFVMPAMQRGWNEHGCPTPRMADYYRARAAGGISLIIGESAAVDHPASSDQPTAAHLYGAALKGWEKCIAAVHAEGGRMFLQLWHEGAVRKMNGPGAVPSISPSGLVQKGVSNGSPATRQDLDNLKASFVRAALSAQSIGADGIEIHCAHGYLLDLFLWAETNNRDDGYGGPDIRHRARFIAELVTAVRAAVGADFPISLRFSQWKEVDFEASIVNGPDELEVFLHLLRAAGVDVFHPSTRRFWLPAWPGSPRSLAGWVKAKTDAPVIAVGSVGLDRDVMANHFGEDAEPSRESIDELMQRFSAHEFDLVAIGRVSIGDPNWVSKLRDGRYSEMRRFTKDDFAADIVWDSSFVEAANHAQSAIPK